MGTVPLKAYTPSQAEIKVSTINADKSIIQFQGENRLLFYLISFLPARVFFFKKLSQICTFSPGILQAASPVPRPERQKKEKKAGGMSGTIAPGDGRGAPGLDK